MFYSDVYAWIHLGLLCGEIFIVLIRHFTVITVLSTTVVKYYELYLYNPALHHSLCLKCSSKNLLEVGGSNRSLLCHIRATITVDQSEWPWSGGFVLICFEISV